MPLVAIAYYTTNSKYKIEAQQQIVTTNVGLEVKKFSMLSLNRKQFVNHLPLEKICII
jgi:hypothetical protein